MILSPCVLEVRTACPRDRSQTPVAPRGGLELEQVRCQIRMCCKEKERPEDEIVMVALLRARLDVRNMTLDQWRTLIAAAFDEVRTLRRRNA